MFKATLQLPLILFPFSSVSLFEVELFQKKCLNIMKKQRARTELYVYILVCNIPGSCEMVVGVCKNVVLREVCNVSKSMGEVI